MAFLQKNESGESNVHLEGHYFVSEDLLHCFRWALAFATSSTVESLTLAGCSDLCLKIALQSMSFNPRIKSLQLRCNACEFTDQTVMIVAEAMLQPALESLSLQVFRKTSSEPLSSGKEHAGKELLRLHQAFAPSTSNRETSSKRERSTTRNAAMELLRLHSTSPSSTSSREGDFFKSQ